MLQVVAVEWLNGPIMYLHDSFCVGYVFARHLLWSVITPMYTVQRAPKLLICSLALTKIYFYKNLCA